VPSAALGDLLERYAAALAAELGCARLALVERTGKRPPQREMANAVQQAANVRGAFAVAQAPPPGSAGVLLDDRRSSGWTLAMVGGQLRRAGAGAVVPAALATIN
jgi:ATP-dependent DNA helicase RecQ